MSRRTFRRSVLKRCGSLAALATIPVTGAAATRGDETGTLAMTVYGERVVDGQLVAEPLPEVEVWDTTGASTFYDGSLLGETDEEGRFETTLEAGDRSLGVRYDYGRYYSTEDDGIDVEIQPDQTTRFEYDFLPDTIRVIGDYQTEFGKALYLTGETNYLGNWQRARRMNYREISDSWLLVEQLPAGAECKIVRADWSENEWISTDDVDWETGSNRVLPEQTSGPWARLDASPEF